MDCGGKNDRSEDRRRDDREEMRRLLVSEPWHQRRVFGEPHTASDMPATLCEEETPGYRVWAAEIGGRVVGLIGLVPVGNKAARIAWFRIEPEWQHTSVLVKLIGQLHEHCRSQGYRRVALDVRLAPQWMWRMLARSGFRLLRRIRGPRSEVLEFGLMPRRQLPYDC
jgi:RimJ/RimL family protein N-acetyltransferase